MHAGIACLPACLPACTILTHASSAQGTNAWTDTDNTVYTLETAGKQGFLNLLPVYLDHILYPTMTDEAFATEVHHIDGKGQDAGVVYCEMQARENTGDSRVERELLRQLYPGKCGYKSETGGMLAPIRALGAHTVRDYHAAYYRPENLCLIVVGKVPTQDLLDTINAVEENVLAKRKITPAAPFERPWMSAVPPLPASLSKTISYPAQVCVSA